MTAHEHGLPLLAPFLGRMFMGRNGPNSVEEYFKLLQKYLTYENMSFGKAPRSIGCVIPICIAIGEWVVDTEVRRVSVKGTAKFKWIEGVGDGHWWDEKFAYMLDFDDEGKVTDYQVWADSGATYLAWKGRLNQKREVSLPLHQPTVCGAHREIVGF